MATPLARRHQQPHPVREQLLLLDATMYWNPWPSRPTGILPLQCREVSHTLHDPSSRSNHPINHDVRRHGTTVSPRCRTPLNNFTLRRLHVAHRSEREDLCRSRSPTYRTIVVVTLRQRQRFEDSLCPRHGVSQVHQRGLLRHPPPCQQEVT